MSNENISKTARSCPVCGSDQYKHFSYERTDSRKVSEFTYSSRKQPEFMCLRLVRCTNCDLVYAPTPPTTEFLSTAYSGAAYDTSEEALFAAHSYAQALSPHIALLPGRGAAADIGAGCGALLPWLSECGFSPVIGIEPSRAAIDAAPTEIRSMLREGMFSPSLLNGTKPTLLCSFMTLEHMVDPRNFVDTAYNLLEPGGMFALVVHNWRAPLNRTLGLRSPIIDIEHLQLFSPDSARAVLTQAGFTSISIRAIRNTYPIRYWLRLSPLPVRLKSILSKIFVSIGISNAPISLPAGNILAIGFKSLAHQANLDSQSGTQQDRPRKP